MNIDHNQIIFFAPHGLFTPETEIMHSVLLDKLYETDSTESILIYYCGGGFSCTINPLKSSAICSLCKERNINFYDEVKQKSNAGNRLKHDFISPNTKYTNLPKITRTSDIREYEYKNTDCGYAVLSTYIGITRDFEPDITDKFTANFLQNLAITYCQIYDYFIKLFETNSIVQVNIFNGRLNNNRAVLRACQYKKIDVICHELVGRSDKITKFVNVLPHDIEENIKNIEALYTENICEAEDIAAEFYKSKKFGKALSDRSYVANQKLGKLPPNWDASKKNIVIFSSSEDEFKAIGKEWNGGVFSDQLTGVKLISDMIDADAHDLYLRIHPNVNAACKKYKKQVFGLNHNNLNLVLPNSDVSTYEMMTEADLIITFGSTIGLEAAYWGKPSILIGNSFYKQLGSTYNPNCVDELHRLIHENGLIGKPKLGAIKMAVFWCKNGTKSKHFDGSKDSGYTFRSKSFSLSLQDKIIYKFNKLITKIIQMCRLR
jgi:hypothetical protein